MVAICIACSDDIIDQNVIVNSSQTGVLTRSGGDNKYDLLGFGYDITGQFLTNASAKAQVIDPVALKKDEDKRIDTNQLAISEGLLMSGTTAEDYTKNLSIHFKVYSDSDSVSAFKGSLESSFSNSEHYSAKYSIASYSLLMKMRQLYMTAPNEMLMKYLTKSFKDDLESQNMEYIIMHYGTHVLTNITLGARLDIMYRSLVTSTMKKQTVESGCSFLIRGVFGINTDGHIDETLVNDNTYQKLVYKAIGGDPNKPFVGSINSEKLTSTTINISEWQSSCDTTNMQLISAEPNTIIPIYELVEDPIKKQMLKAAVLKYMKERSFVDFGDPVPLYRYIYEGEIRTISNTGSSRRGGENKLVESIKPVKDYYYTTDFGEYGNEKDGYTYDKILCYVYPASEHPTGAIPLYEYLYKIKSTSNKVKSYYTTNWYELEQGNELYKYRRIACYVFSVDNKPSNSVPLYSFSREYESSTLRPYHFFVDLSEAKYGEDNSKKGNNTRGDGSGNSEGSSGGSSGGSRDTNGRREGRNPDRPRGDRQTSTTNVLFFAGYASGPDTYCYVLPVNPPK